MTPLHHVGEFFRELLLGVPLGAARGLFLATFIGVLLWVLTLPREETADSTNRRNLKPWAVLALIVQIVIYSML